jgi:hypothetical protein
LVSEEPTAFSIVNAKQKAHNYLTTAQYYNWNTESWNVVALKTEKGKRPKIRPSMRNGIVRPVQFQCGLNAALASDLHVSMDRLVHSLYIQHDVQRAVLAGAV